jgi:hypothetical protein
MTRKKIILPFLAAIIALSANAQTDSTKTFVLSGSVDAYFRSDFNNAPAPTTNNFTSFTNSNNSFELGMATLRADGSALSGKVLATADLGFGRRADEFSYPTAGTSTTLTPVKQLFVSYTPGKAGSGVKFTIGKWGTHIGYEVLDAYANRNYSMDYMFSYGPFSHTGIKAEWSHGTWGFMLGVANPTDNATTTATNKVAIAQISDGTKNGKWKFYLNYQGSFGLGQSGSGTQKDFNQFDLVVTGTVSSKFSVGANGTIYTAGYNTVTGGSTPKATAWGGAAVYLNWDPTAMFGLTLRSEDLINNDAMLALSTNVLDETLSANFRFGPVTIIPEVRYESSKEEMYFKGKDATPTKSDFSGILAAVYKF